MKSRVEVLIVGAGPVGLTLAIDCALRGLSVAIVDKAKCPSIHSKALAIWSAAQEYLSSLGVLDEMRQEGIQPEGIRFYARGAELLRIPSGLGVDSPYPGFLILPQSQTEHILRRRLASLDREIEQEVEFIGYEEQGGEVIARLRRAEGEEFPWACDFLVGCDGAHSAVRHALGTRFEGRARPETFILCDAEVQGPNPLSQEILLFASRSGPLPMLPIREKLWRIISTRHGDSGTAPPTLEEMQEHLEERGPGNLTLANPQWLSSFRISERRAADFRRGRVMLAGDAAHIHSPAGGQGMNTGILDAANLAWKLEAVLRHRGKPDILLQSYHAERAAAADRVIREAAARTRIALAGMGILAAARNLIARWAGHSRTIGENINTSLAGTHLHYPSSPALGSDHHWHEDWRDHGFAPGRLVRDVKVVGEGRSLSLLPEIFSARRMSLLLFSGRRPNYRDAAALQQFREEAAASNFPLTTFAIWHGEHTPDDSWLGDPEGHAHRRFGAYSRAACVVRPDGISAFRTQPADWPRTKDFLEQFFDPQPQTS